MYLWYSTFHPSLRMFPISSCIVRTFPLSTAVHVGTIAPSPASDATTCQRDANGLRAIITIPISLWVSTSPPYLGH